MKGLDHIDCLQLFNDDPDTRAILMIGGRGSNVKLTYPVSSTAQQHGAGVDQETDSPKEAYAGSPESTAVRARWPLGGTG